MPRTGSAKWCRGGRWSCTRHVPGDGESPARPSLRLSHCAESTLDPRPRPGRAAVRGPLAPLLGALPWGFEKTVKSAEPSTAAVGTLQAQVTTSSGTDVHPASKPPWPRSASCGQATGHARDRCWLTGGGCRDGARHPLEGIRGPATSVGVCGRRLCLRAPAGRDVRRIEPVAASVGSS